MPETLPAGMRVKERNGYRDNPNGKVVAATSPDDPPPGPGYVRVKWDYPVNTYQWVPVGDLEPATT